MFRRHRWRARLEGGQSAVLGGVRSARRRLDGVEICRQPLCRAGRRSGGRPHEPGSRHQRQPPMAASEPLRRSRDARLRSQRRPGSTVERARSFVRLQPRDDHPVRRRVRLAECQRIHRRTAAATSGQPRALGRLYAPRETQSAGPAQCGRSDQYVHQR